MKIKLSINKHGRFHSKQVRSRSGVGLFIGWSDDNTGHFGMDKLYTTLHESFYWRKIQKHREISVRLRHYNYCYITYIRTSLNIGP